MENKKTKMPMGTQKAGNESLSIEETTAASMNVTEEQVSDVYMAGSSDGIIQLEGDKELHIPQKGYEG
jgi:hypothetical protein